MPNTLSPEEQEIHSQPTPPEQIQSPTYLSPEDESWQEIREREQWNHVDLHKAVYDTLFALPGFFKSELKITGVLATDFDSLLRYESW